jgi:hypothetical protein
MRRTRLGAVLLAMAVTELSGCCDYARQIRAARAVSLRVPWQGYSKLVVRMVDGSVEITSGTSSEAEISAKLSVGGIQAEKRLDRLELVAAPDSTDPTALLVRLKYPPDWGRWSPGADVSILVPVACDVDASTVYGDICVSDVLAARLQACNGAIRAERVNGCVDARTTFGDIVLHDVRGECHALTYHGAMEITAACGGGIDVGTCWGDTSVQATPPPNAPVRMSTSYGDVRATLPATMAGVLEAHNARGNVKVEFGSGEVQDLVHERNLVRARINGGGVRIDASSSLGSIAIKFVD